MCRKEGLRAATEAERKALGIPPAYTNVMVSDDPKADLVATAFIPKTGKTFYRYSKAFTERNAVKKFARVQKLLTKIGKVEAKILKDCAATDPEDRALAVCARLVLLTGIRAGGAPQGEGESFGASSLLLAHCSFTDVPNIVVLDFIGKKGVPQHVVVNDAIFSAYVLSRGHELRLFPHEANALLRYMKSLGVDKTHDLRTLRAMLLAEALIEELTKDGLPETKKEAKALRKAVGTAVAGVLGNSPSQALKSYISAKVWPKLDLDEA